MLVAMCEAAEEGRVKRLEDGVSVTGGLVEFRMCLESWGEGGEGKDLRRRADAAGHAGVAGQDAAYSQPVCAKVLG